MKNLSRAVRSGPPARWSWYYRTLLRLRAALIHAHHARSDALRTPSEKGGCDVIDLAGDLQDQDELLSELAVEEIELSEVEAALQRLRTGTYGICAATGKRIPASRLRAIPWTRFTQSAAALREHSRR